MTKKVNINEVAATQETNNNETIGYLCWYSVGEGLYEREKLRQTLLSAGLSEGYLPNEIRAADAFRRATKAIETTRIPGNKEGVYFNYIVRNVVSNKDEIQRNIVEEKVDKKGKTLDYQQNTAILRFIRKKEEMQIAVVDDGMAKDLAEEAQKLYKLYRTHHNGQAVRSSVLEILKSMSPTPVRPSGGVYFIPVKYQKKLRAFIRFVSRLKKGEGYMIPLIDTKDNRDMVRAKVEEHLKAVLDNCVNINRQKGELQMSKIKQTIEEAKRVVSDFNEYKSSLAETVEGMESHVDLIRQQIQLLLEKN